MLVTDPLYDSERIYNQGPDIAWIYFKEEWQIKRMAVFFFIAHEKGFKFHAQPQSGAYSC